jgi:DNA-binding NtrC family response regulator
MSPTKSNIAVVDDEPSLCVLYSLILRKQGHHIVFVGKSGEEIVDAIAKGKLRKDNLETVLLDYRLGNEKLDGLETAALIKQQIPTTRIIIISAGISVKTQAVVAGLSYIPKQFSVDEFLDTVGNDGKQQGEKQELDENGAGLQRNFASTN